MLARSVATAPALTGVDGARRIIRWEPWAGRSNDRLTVEVGRRLILRADPPPARPVPTPLVGREPELAILREALRISAADARAIAIGGDAGSGKTALLDAIRGDAHTTGVAVVEGACVEIESRRPFGAFADVVASCERVFGSERVERSLRERGTSLRRLVAPGAPGDGARPGDRYQMHGALLGLFIDLSGDGPLAVFVEDLHWADDASLELFGYLARRLRTHPVLLVATYRTDELDRRHPLRPVLADLRKARLILDVPLRALDPEGTGALITLRLGLRDAAPLDAREFRDLVNARCEGNPLHTEETLATLRQRGLLRFADGAWTCDVGAIRDAIPASVADGVVARWSALTPLAQHILLVAAVAGHRIDPHLVADVSGTGHDALAPLIHEALDARLVVEDTNDQSLSFRHALTREALLQQLLRSERVALHARIARSLERRGKPVRAAELAYHLEESGELAKASRYHEAAAREAAASTDYRGAARSMERAIATAPDDGAVQGRRQLDLVGYLRLSGDDPRARRAAAAALAIGERTGDASLQAGALLDLYNGEYRNSDVAPALEPLDRALALLEPLGPAPELARAYSARAAHLSRVGDAKAAMIDAQRARTIATVLARPAELAWATMQIGLAHVKQGDLAAGIAACREAVEIARSADLIDELYGTLVTLRVQLVVAGASSAEQRDVQLQMRAVARSHGLGKQAWIVRELGFLHQEAAWDAFLRLVPQVPQPELSDFDQPRLMALFIAVARGGPAALADLDCSRLLAEYGNSAPSACWATELLLLAGRAEESVTLALAIREEDTTRRHWGLIPASVVHAIGLFAARECDVAQARPRFIHSLLTERPLPAAANFNRRHIALANADIAETEGRIDDALAAYTIAVAECERSQFNSDVMYLMTLIQKRMAELHLRRTPTDMGAAQAQLDAIVPYWERAKATWYLGQLHTWANGLGLAFPATNQESATPLAAPRQLTRRELEVARLVAEGLTNREIGVRFGLSVRTAEGHVEQIREKLGFKTRAQIASWITQRYG